MLLLLLVAAAMLLPGGTVEAHGVSPAGWPVNPALGVAGFPDCVRSHPPLAGAVDTMTMEEAGLDLVCSQRPSSDHAIRIACVGDSITAGVHSSGGNHTYPARLQMLLDAKYGWGAYSVTNLGACGSTMQRGADSPYWLRPQYTTLLNGTWDVVTVMLGTNDAKDTGSGGPPNWPHQCTDPVTGAPRLNGCTYADDFQAFIDVVRGLGRAQRVPPLIVAVIPPPLLRQGAYGMNETVINDLLPALVPLIATRANSTNISDGGVSMGSTIDIYTAMGGVKDWREKQPAKGCTVNSSYPPCAYWCDAQSCDQCHPNDVGYAHLAGALHDALAAQLPPPFPRPSPPTPPPSGAAGAWIYEAGGDGRLFIPAANFTSNGNSGRGGQRAWDACKGGVGALRFDNGDPVFTGAAPGGGVGAVRAVGATTTLRGARECGKTYNYPNMSVSYAFGAADGIRYEQWLYLEMERDETDSRHMAH